MTGFDEREKGWEKKVQQDSEFRFKVEMLRNKMIGEWAAQQMGMNESEFEAYVDEVVKADFEEVGEDDVVRKLLADLQAKDLDIDEEKVRKKIEQYNQTAAQQLMDGE